jgi:enoyl-CoA hydratase
MATSFENILYAVEGKAALITVNRPKALNALNFKTLDEILDAIRFAAGDPGVAGIILTGSGEKAFIAGADIVEMANMHPIEAKAFADKGHHVGEALESIPKVVIAAVNGFALGGGCEMALACDLILASNKARFGQPEVNLGVIPGFGGSQRLPRRVGLGASGKMIYTGDMVDASEALRIGLADEVVAPEELLARAKALIEKIATKGPVAIGAAKELMRRGAAMNLGDALSLESQSFSWLFSTEDQKEGMKAFVEKRTPNFKGR